MEMTDVAFDGLTDQERNWLFPDNQRSYQREAEREARVRRIRAANGRPLA